MNIPVKNINDITVSDENGILFIDSADNLLKLKTKTHVIIFNKKDDSSNSGNTGGGETGEIIGYTVAGITGSTIYNGDYTYKEDYNGKPYYNFTNTNNHNLSYCLFFSEKTNSWALNTGHPSGLASYPTLPPFYQDPAGETPDSGTWISTNSSVTPPTSITPIYDGDTGGGDTGGGDTPVTGFKVDNAGHTACRGTYLEVGTYNNYPMYQYSTYYLRRIPDGNWQISDGTATLYMGTIAESPDLCSWVTAAGASPVPTVTPYNS